MPIGRSTGAVGRAPAGVDVMLRCLPRRLLRSHHNSCRADRAADRAWGRRPGDGLATIPPGGYGVPPGGDIDPIAPAFRPGAGGAGEFQRVRAVAVLPRWF